MFNAPLASLPPAEALKASDPLLAGALAQTLANPDLDRVSDEDAQFLKFHGAYQQDDRDLRKTGKKYIFMVRGRLPGGYVTPDQYLAFDQLSEEHGNCTLRITTRQGFQFHGVVKRGLLPVIRGINGALATTLAACGDVNRNVMAPPTPSRGALTDRVLDDARKLSKSLLPKTRAYHEIWIEGKAVITPEPEFEDPLYGKTYLPRKFKIGFAIPPLNDVDVFTNCIGFVAITQGESLIGYNLLAGGGMGMSHGNAQTFPRLADVIGFLRPDQVEAFAKASLTIHRDFGDRSNRRHARLKYVVEERGAEWFRTEVEKRAGSKLDAAHPCKFERQGDLFGWHAQGNGKQFLGLYVESGRIRDGESVRLKTALREAVARFRPDIRLTPSQNLILAEIAPENREPLTQLLQSHGVQVERQGSKSRLASLACPALPTCGLALAESERFLPALIAQFEAALAESGLADEEIILRTTGCPNGCARPYMAEIGIVGKAPNKYQIYLGGNKSSTRLAWLYRENVKAEELVSALRPVLGRFAKERRPGEGFGDFCARHAAEMTAPAGRPPQTEKAAVHGPLDPHP